MAQTTIDDGPRPDTASEQERRDQLRSLVPVAVSVTLLLAVAFAMGLALEELVSFGAWFIAND